MGLKAALCPVTPFEQNCSLIWCDETMKGAVVDPGGDLDRIYAGIKKSGFTLEKILLTHGHLDHASAAGELAQATGVPIEGPHKDDLFLLDSLPTQAAMFNFPAVKKFLPTRWLVGGDTVSVGNLTLDVRHCPGHTPGHVIFFDAARKFAMVGDVLFKGSIGRTDFPKGNYPDLLRSITTQLWPLGDDVTFVPGHGPLSTFGAERRSNPFVGDAALERVSDP